MTALKKRDNYIDNLRLLIIILVIVLHTAITYSGVGNWHYMESESSDMVTGILLALFIIFTNSYFMSLLFLISGFYSSKSLSNRSKKHYIKSRFKRLGIPYIIGILIIYPLTKFIMSSFGVLGSGVGVKEFFMSHYITLDLFNNSGPLWFCFALLILSIIYALFPKFTKPMGFNFPKFGVTILFIIILGSLNFLVRLLFPFGVEILNIPMSYALIYILAFVLGVVSHRNDWLTQINYKYSKRWLLSTLILGSILWMVIIVTGGVMEQGDHILSGNLNWQGFVYSIWDTFIFIGMTIGLLGLFREKFNYTSRGISFGVQNSFKVYICHMPVLVTISLILRSYEMHSLIKTIIVASLAIVFSFILSHLFSRVESLRS